MTLIKFFYLFIYCGLLTKLTIICVFFHFFYYSFVAYAILNIFILIIITYKHVHDWVNKINSKEFVNSMSIAKIIFILLIFLYLRLINRKFAMCNDNNSCQVAAVASRQQLNIPSNATRIEQTEAIRRGRIAEPYRSVYCGAI